MRPRRLLTPLLLVAALSACVSGRVVHAEGGVRDAGTTPRDDAATGDDAFVDPGADAFVPPGPDAGVDAFVPPVVDAGRDAFVPPSPDSGPTCTPLPTTTPLVIDGHVGAGATYNRPTTDCGPLSTTGNRVFYATHVFCHLGAARTYSFALDSAAVSGIADPFVVVFTGTGDVSMLSCLASDDDRGAIGNDSLATVAVPTGNLTVVASDYYNDSTGDYRLTITPM